MSNEDLHSAKNRLNTEIDKVKELINAQKNDDGELRASVWIVDAQNDRASSRCNCYVTHGAREGNWQANSEYGTNAFAL